MPSAVPGFLVIRRNGAVTPFDAGQITIAVTKAYLAVEGGRATVSRRMHEVVAELTCQVVAALTRRGDAGRAFHIEEIQEQVELALMRGEHHKVARAYVLYREERTRARAAAKPVVAPGTTTTTLKVKQADGTLVPLDDARLTAIVEEACAGLSDVSAEPIRAETRRNLYDGITLDELALAPVMAARTLIEKEPN
jgi:ribonucleoside-diphosphate reductase alpha chain